ncbi:hypothetical protein PCO31111_03047 [Pandoraea communis]|uniref:Uncharacterized protein n=1 Tax=Pandoraea communis TaxID=2508297 RepID=A0A5E4W298_9BURK|nr:hypothetical protein PCO31111_03047 [Pandoraea communis]
MVQRGDPSQLIWGGGREVPPAAVSAEEVRPFR